MIAEKILDKRDRQILSLLQADGRATAVELAERIGLSHTAVSERLKRLRREGFIEGFRAVLNPDALGLGMLLFIEIRLDRTTPELFGEFRARINAMPEIMECHMVAGGFDYLAKARVRDMDGYRRFLAESLLGLPGVRETHTYPVIEETKAFKGYEIRQQVAGNR